MKKNDFLTMLPVTAHTDYVGQGTTFVAIKGMKEDGTAYITRAVELGARRIVIEEGTVLAPTVQYFLAASGIEVTVVPSTRRALATLSAEAHGYPANSLKLIGITGTKGKTTTAFLIEHLLRTAGYRTALVSTVENRIGSEVFKAPLTTPQPDYLHAFFAECRARKVEYVVMEVAAQALSVDRVESLSFDTTLFTNFSLEHSEFYKTQDEYFAAKCRLFEFHSSGKMLFNADDQCVFEYARRYEKALTYGVHTQAAFKGTVLSTNLTQLTLTLNGVTYTTQGLLGDFNASNIVAACAAVEPYIADVSVLQEGVRSFEGVPGRLQRYTLPNGAVAFIDNAHTPSSVDAVLGALRPLTDTLIVVFGAGGDRDSSKRPLMGNIATRYADTVFLTTDNPRSEDPSVIIDDIQRGIDSTCTAKVIRELDRKEAIVGAYALSKQGAIIALLGKGPVEYQEVKDVKIPFSEAAILKSF